jgi:putative tryptophan/tyrosine transport system substrate-binding protein
VDLIFAPSTNAALAAKNASATIPIVFASVADPVANELVGSLARPGGNLTGPSQMSAELSGKRMELIKEVVPRLSHVAVLRDQSRQSDVALKETHLAAEALGAQLRIFEVQRAGDLETVFLDIAKQRPNALIVLSSPMLLNDRVRITALATKHRLPGVYTLKEYTDAGGLMSYGVSLPALFRRAAIYVDKILKGAKPAELPVEQPTKFELVINLKTAKQIGLTIPPNVLARADRVIK